MIALEQDAGVDPWVLTATDWMISLAAGCAVLVLYVYTLAPTIVAGDAGELVTAAYELGVPHPPGYPLWCLLARVFIAMFDGIKDVAHRVNLLSACCGAVVCTLIYHINRKMGLGKMASFAGALLLGASRELWGQSIIAEVYALNAAIFTACLLCLVMWDHRRNDRWLLAFAFLLGLGFTNHHTIGIIGLAGLALVLLRRWRTILNWRLDMAAIALFLLPLSLYLYLPLRSASGPYMDWGHPETLRQLWDHVTRVQYKINYTPEPRTAVSVCFQLVTLIRYFLDQFSPVVGLSSLVAIPLVLRWRRESKWWAMCILFAGITFTYGWLLNTKFERQEIDANRVFFIPAYCCAAILAAGVLDSVYKWLLSLVSRRLSVVSTHLICGLCLLVPATAALKHNYTANDFSEYWYAEDHAQNILATLENDSVIFPSGDHNTFPLIYLHRVEKMRPDITIADKYGYIEARDFPEIRNDGSGSGRVPRNQVIHYLLSQTSRPVYFTVKYNVPGRLDVQQIQTGLLYRVSREPPKTNPDNLWALYRYRNAGDGFTALPDYGAVNVVSDYFFFRGLSNLKSGEVKQALSALSNSAFLAQGIKEVYNNIGSALAEHGLLTEAQQYYQEALSLDEGYINALWNVARTSSALGDYQAADGYFKQLYKVASGDYRVPGELGFLNLRHLGNTKQAVDYFNTSLQLNANQSQIEKVLKELEAVGAGEDIEQILSVDRQSHDFGEIALGESRKTEFVLTNISKEPLDLTDIRADCGCVVPKLPATHLEPGETAAVEVTYKETKRTGPSSKRVTIKTSTNHKLQLDIRATVVPLFGTTPSVLDIPAALPNIMQTQELIVEAHDKKSFKIKSVESTLQEVQPVLSEGLRQTDKKHILTVQIRPGMNTGRQQGKLDIYIDEPNGAVVEVPITLVVRKPVVLTPRSIFLSSVARAGNKNVTVTIDLPADWAANITAIATSAEWLTVQNPPSLLRGKTALNCQINTQQLPGTFSGTITIQTDHPSVSNIVIPVYGFVKQ